MIWTRHSTYHQSSGRYSVCFIASPRPHTAMGHFEAWLGNQPNMATYLGAFGTAQEARTHCELHSQRRP